uniref:Uncharacterized protein n=1 Tax=Arundo donax TaxID=35708 RepID=A0A0A9DF81_ARUDO
MTCQQRKKEGRMISFLERKVRCLIHTQEYFHSKLASNHQIYQSISAKCRQSSKNLGHFTTFGKPVKSQKLRITAPLA